MYDSEWEIVWKCLQRFSIAIETSAATLAEAIKYHADATRTAHAKAEVPKWEPPGPLAHDGPTCAACGAFMIGVGSSIEPVWVCINCGEKSGQS